MRMGCGPRGQSGRPFGVGSWDGVGADRCGPSGARRIVPWASAERTAGLGGPAALRIQTHRCEADLLHSTRAPRARGRRVPAMLSSLTTAFGLVDAVIVVLYLVATLAIGLLAGRLIKGMATFVVAGRGLGTALSVAAMTGSELGLITVMYQAEKGFTGGPRGAPHRAGGGGGDADRGALRLHRGAAPADGGDDHPRVLRPAVRPPDPAAGGDPAGPRRHPQHGDLSARLERTSSWGSPTWTRKAACSP